LLTVAKDLKDIKGIEEIEIKIKALSKKE